MPDVLAQAIAPGGPLSDAVQWAQIASTLIAALAAGFSYMAARAASRATGIALDVRRRELAELAQTRRPTLVVSVAAAVDGGRTRYTLQVKNTDDKNEAHELQIETSAKYSGPYRPASWPYTLAPGAEIMSHRRKLVAGQGRTKASVEAEGEGKRVAYGRLRFRDVHGLARWQYTFSLVEAMTFSDGKPEYDYSIMQQPVPTLISEDAADQSTLTTRVRLAWLALRGKDE
ncbi:hypothetical protein [Actinomycetospora atypica]|uniref:hypothetical protein n=1 Tax=Actinomycetospora atypica TaxID=1290095 RepID=UPI00366BBF29